jgi:hypothetical protein
MHTTTLPQSVWFGKPNGIDSLTIACDYQNSQSERRLQILRICVTMPDF